MVFLWTGQGFLVFFIVFGCLMGAEFITEIITLDDKYYQTHAWPKAVAFLIGSVITWFKGISLNSLSSRTVVDPETGRKTISKRVHTFFFIPFEFWAPLVIVLGIVLI